MQIRTEVIQSDRLTFQCRVAGSPEDMPVLLVHGSFGSSRWWEPFMRLLADGFYLVAPDLRGSGATSSAADRVADMPRQIYSAGEFDVSEAYAIDNQAQDLAALIEALGWDEFDLVGHSSGGAIAIEYALTFPHRVRTLTLVDSAPIEGVFTPVDMFMLLEQMRTDRELLRQALAALMPTYPIEDTNSQAPAYAGMSPAEFFNQLVDDAMHMAPAAFTAGAEALSRWNRFAAAGELTMPTLLVWGELDSIVNRDSTTRMLIAIPGANNLEVLRNVGHSPMIEAPVALAERFVEFVTDDLDDFEQVRRDALE